MQYFVQQVLDYSAQIKRYGLNINFAFILNIDDQVLTWPLAEEPPTGTGSPISPDVKKYAFQMELTWEDRKIGHYYWTGFLDSHQQTINRLLIDNMLTKIFCHSQMKNNISCGIGVLESAIQAIEAKDQYTRGHSDRVSHIALELADRIDLELNKTDVEIASRLHDIGKIGVSEQVLTKPTGLTDNEIALIRRHPDIGANILKPLTIFTHLVPAIRHHHEKFDGTGYPDKLAGSEIPILSRIIAVADTYDALTSNRPYRRALPPEQALEIVLNARYSQLDPDIVDLFLKT